MQITSTFLDKVRDLNEQGLFLQSYNFARSILPLENWEGTEETLTAASIAYNLGAEKLSRRLSQKAWRSGKTNAKAIFYRAIEILSTRGILSALLFLRANEETFKADDRTTAWWFSLHADIYSVLRDFKEASLWHLKAVEILPDEPWVWVVRSRSLELQDRYQEALETSRKAYELDPSNRPAIQSYCHISTLLEQDERALDVLKDAASRLENIWIFKQLGDLQTELELHEDAYSSFKKILELTPFNENDLDEWVYSSLSDAAYFCGDLESSVEFMEKINSPFHKKIRENLKSRNGNGEKKLLRSGFIRQHQMTCAPATLANVSRFWGKPAEHLEVAEKISYNGTPAHKERLWAEQNDWETREFSLNWDDTEKLIDRKVPFTLATVQPGNGHLQAVVGYDGARGTILIRDPFFRNIIECNIESLLEDQVSSGPRAMALVPKDKAQLLSDLNLKESKQYDFLFRVETELEKFNRSEARKILDEMEAAFPNDRITLYARWALASYDANSLDLLETVEQLREKFPDDVNFKLTYLSITNEHLSREERLKILEDFSNQKSSDPLIWQMFGFELGFDAGEHSRAMKLLYRTARKLPTDGATYRFIADILWSQRNFEDAEKLYRLAACLNDKDEQFAYSYFLAARHLKKTDDALLFLRDRFERFGKQSNKPAESLFHALNDLGRTLESFEILADALEKRPDDGELKLFAAEANARYGKINDAKVLLEKAKDNAQHGNWLRKAALLEQLQGNLKKSLSYWEEIIKSEPIAADAHENVALMISYIEGIESAQTYLKKVTGTFPFNRKLQKLRLSFLNEKTTESIAVLRNLIKLNPRDAWSHRELARWLAKVKKFETAVESADTAIQIDPADPLNHWTKANVLALNGKKEEAAEYFKKA
ncbi:MAG: C39 family peptidase [Pyrinomonadaceae bacterium]|nr:C39 family peptidase [Pyrinomonadaceae bacterium]